MSEKRRYTEDEVARILDRATEVQTEQGHALSTGEEGMTLDELKEIGAEAGISTDLIARAASELDRPAPALVPKKRVMGVPISVGRTVYFDRKLTDDEWDRLVVDLRETFDARGTVREEGAFRMWNNGNLQALLEPTPEGERLRLKTTKGQARALMSVGSVFMAIASVMMVIAFLGLGSASTIQTMITMGVMGAAFFTISWAQLPRWASTRELQMEGVAARALAAVSQAEED